MAESTIQVRLVRCPKCKNLLPEPKDCNFFQCGGCGTVLCAKNKDCEADSVSVKSVGSNNRAKEETQVNSRLSEEESDSDASLRQQQQNGQTRDFHIDPCSKLKGMDSGNNDTQSGLDRFRERTTKRCDSEGYRFSTSNDIPDSLYSSDEAIKQDRAGLVRKLDKLKEQLLQPKEQPIPSSSSGFEKAPLRFFSSGKHVAGSSYYHHYPETEPPCLYSNNLDVSLHGSMHNPAHVPANGVPLGFKMNERTLKTSYPHYSRQYIGNNGHDLFDTHSRNGTLHQSNCSCVHCYDPYHRASGSVFPPSGLPDALRNTGFYTHERSTEFSSLHSPRAFIPRRPPGSQSRGPQLHGRYANELGDAQMNVISRVRHLKAVSSSGGSRLIYPVAGGAPFINCKKCFKLLKLPEKIDSSARKKQRLRCGGCSCLIEFSFVDKKLIVSTDPASARKAETHNRLHWATAANFSSDDYDNSADEFNAMDRGPAHVSTDLALISDKAQEMMIADSTSSSESEDELSSDSPTVTPDSPLHKHFEYSSINVRDRSGPRNRSSRSEQDRVTLSKTSMRQNSIKEASVAIEMDVNDYSHNSGLSQDSANDYTDDQGRTKKGGFASIVKSSFKDLKKSMQNEGRSDVAVNGHPVAERLVKMAEKQAGPIRPGNYWYDYRAGFWGIMGSHCLGILPPFIEELNYPMPENCAGGTTGVFVNGRELHQKDLRLLTARGLPRDRDRSYTVYISGRVIDEDTGEELDSLGKLAPTVDKLKRGFGMRVPRRAA
ncbi:Extra-large guanine nucleotide-binding protein 1 [Cardamine amara subsp. amara]|uniref:Extra-large guanine nucleotide-binding protein 1 n=1 Tax=Cardamine amara subsp. amara TaxID=228776 RepID=A0ABD0ZA70_CARAN